MTGTKDIMTKIKIYHFYFLTLLANKAQTIQELNDLATNENFSHYTNNMIRTLLGHLCTLDLVRQKKIKEGRRKYSYTITAEGKNVVNRIKNIING